MSRPFKKPGLPDPDYEHIISMLKISLYSLATLILVAVIAAAFFYMNPDAATRFMLKPSDPFVLSNAPPAPDYADPASWAALPDRRDGADVLPSATQLTDNQAQAAVDVFFVHPTTYYVDDSWNAAFNESGRTDEFLTAGVLRFQASVFNGSARIYAPRYRQATLYSFLGDEADGYEALKLAAGDVERAFEHFITRYNQERPFILASHSQGSLHSMKLLQEKIAGTALAERLVAAYLIGYPVPVDMGIAMRPCETPTSTGCYLNWNAMTEGADGEWVKTGKVFLNGQLMRMEGQPVACVNPLTGRRNDKAEASSNKGSVAFAEEDEPVPAPLPALTGAACNKDSLLIISPVEEDGFEFCSFGGGDYHNCDYNLFYMNFREDIDRRVNAFLADTPRNGRKALPPE